MKKVLIVGLMLVAAALAFSYLRGAGERTGQQVGGAPKRGLDHVRDATKRIEEQQAKQYEQAEHAD